jgi:hypothetical protein
MAQPKRFLLRLDPRLFDALRRWAEDDLRSVNAQIEYLLADRARRAGRISTPRARRASGGSPSGPSSGGTDGDGPPGEPEADTGGAPGAHPPGDLTALGVA